MIFRIPQYKFLCLAMRTGVFFYPVISSPLAVPRVLFLRTMFFLKKVTMWSSSDWAEINQKEVDERTRVTAGSSLLKCCLTRKNVSSQIIRHDGWWHDLNFGILGRSFSQSCFCHVMRRAWRREGNRRDMGNWWRDYKFVTIIGRQKTPPQLGWRPHITTQLCPTSSR